MPSALPPCPRCASPLQALGSSWLLHAVRSVVGSRRRYCRACGQRWHESRVHAPYRLPAIGLAGAVLALGMAFPAIETQIELDAHEIENEGKALASRKGSSSPSTGRLSRGLAARAAPGTLADNNFEGGAPAGVPNGPADSMQAVSARPAKSAAGPKGFWAQVMNNLRTMISTNPRKLSNSNRKNVISDLNSMSKRQLWDKYGGYFGSKDQANGAFNNYKSSGKLPGE